MKKIIIIGAGISGLSAGINLLKKGFSVEIYEKNSTVGGCCSGWYRDGYYIDNCMHWLTGTNQHTSLFKKWKEVGALSENSSLYQEDYFYKTNLGVKSVSLYSDLEKTRKEMYDASNIDGIIVDKKEIDSLIDTISEVVKIYLKLDIFKKFKGYIKPIIKYKNMSLKDLQDKFQTPILKTLLTDYFPKEYSSLALIYAYSTFASGNGKIYQKGSLAFSENILNKFLSLGGKIYYDKEITKINTLDKKAYSITAKDGRIYYADYFVSTTSLDYTFNTLLNNSCKPKEYFKKAIDKINYPIVSSYQAAFVINKPLRPFKDTEMIEIPKTKVGSTIVDRVIIKEYPYLNEDKDKTLYEIMIIQKERDYDYWNNLITKDKKTYDLEKKAIANKIIVHLENTYPNLKGNISLLDTWTPITYNRYFNLFKGSYMGFVFTKKSSIKRISSKTNYKNVFIVSIWQSYTGGLPIALKLGYQIPKYIKK